MNNRTSNPIEDELDVIRLKIYERIKDMTPEEEVAYFRAQNEPIIRQFPTMALIDGRFREALEEEDNTFSREAEAIQLAHLLDLFTIAFSVDRKSVV